MVTIPIPKRRGSWSKKEVRMMHSNSFMAGGINFATSGRKHLGAALGNAVFTEEYISAKVSQWEKELETLCMVAERDPHAAYAALTHG